MLDEFLGASKPKFPNGRLSEEDEGELAFAIATDRAKGVVVVRFTKPVDWIGLDKQSALALANMIIEHAAELTQ